MVTFESLKVRQDKIGVVGLGYVGLPLAVQPKKRFLTCATPKVVDIVHELADYGIEVLVHDPLADSQEAKQYYNTASSLWPCQKHYLKAYMIWLFFQIDSHLLFFSIKIDC